MPTLSINSYLATTVVGITGLMSTLSTGLPVDPTTVQFKYTITNNAVTTGPFTLTYSGASTPSPGVVARIVSGDYVVWLDTTNLPGFWEYEWLTTGTGQAAATGAFNVDALPF